MLKIDLDGHETEIKFHHVTEDDIPLRNPDIPGPRLGTMCRVIQDDEMVYLGIAILHPKEQRNKNKGRKIALARAIADLTRDQRTKIWETYFQVRGKVN